MGGLYDAGYEMNYLGLRVGLKRNTTRAFQLYQAAAEQGHHLAQCHMGSMYAMGTYKRNFVLVHFLFVVFSIITAFQQYPKQYY